MTKTILAAAVVATLAAAVTLTTIWAQGKKEIGAVT